MAPLFIPVQSYLWTLLSHQFIPPINSQKYAGMCPTPPHPTPPDCPALKHMKQALVATWMTEHTQTHANRQTDRQTHTSRQTDRQTNRQTVSRQWSQCSVSRLLVSRSTNDIINIHSWIFTIISTVIHNLTKTTVVRNSKPRPVSHCRVLPPGNPTGCLKKVAPLLKLLRIFSLQLILSAWNFTNLLATHIHIYLCKHPGHHTAGAATWWPCITLQGAANWRPHGPLQGAATWQI